MLQAFVEGSMLPITNASTKILKFGLKRFLCIILAKIFHKKYIFEQYEKLR